MEPRQRGATRLILGLGNPGERYRDTRHNVGFRVVEELARRREMTLGRLECHSLIAEAHDLILAQPMTFMNRSGYAARCLAERRELDPDALLVVYDELWLPLGKLRARPGGSPAGHRGLESVVHSLGTDRVPRIRLGIAPEVEVGGGDERVEFVLAPFTAEERPAVEELIERAADACECWWKEGMETTMARFNG